MTRQKQHSMNAIDPYQIHELSQRISELGRVTTIMIETYGQDLTGSRLNPEYLHSKYLTKQMAAKYLSCSTSTIEKLIRNGELTSYRISDLKSARVLKSELEKILTIKNENKKL